MNRAEAERGFREVFGDAPAVGRASPPAVVRAPGRVNLIGDHTDYVGGLVLPIAIDPSIWVAAGPTSARPGDGSARTGIRSGAGSAGTGIRSGAGSAGTGRIRCHSKLYGERGDVPIDLASCDGLPHWQRYIGGVVIELRARGVPLVGADLWIGGDLPAGAGLASSAALEVGVTLALLAVCGVQMPRDTIADLCRRAENEHAGSPCGIMDQTVCLHAHGGSALRLDCTTLQRRHVPTTGIDAEFVVIDSGVRHSIAAGAYADRRRACAAALDTLRRDQPDLPSLAALRLSDIEGCARRLDPSGIARAEARGSGGSERARRVRHVVTENARVRSAVEALVSGDAAAFGALMLESHASLRDDYEVSCPELDEIVRRASAVPGVHGARMTGGGFGGCAVVLVERHAVGDLLARFTRADHTTPGYTAFPVRPAGSAEVISPIGA